LAAIARDGAATFAGVILKKMANLAGEIDVAGGIGESGVVGTFRHRGPVQGIRGKWFRLRPPAALPAMGEESDSATSGAVAVEEYGVCAIQSPHEANDELARPVSTAAQIDALIVSMQ
jgi:hypothetical protein